MYNVIAAMMKVYFPKERWSKGKTSNRDEVLSITGVVQDHSIGYIPGYLNK